MSASVDNNGGALGSTGAPLSIENDCNAYGEMLNELKVDFAFYRDTYGGALDVEAFSEVLGAATRHVRWFCGGRIPCDPYEVQAYKRAICAAAEVIAELGVGQIGGFQLGSFSVTHYDNRGTTGDEEATYAIEKELVGTSLMFSGVR